MADSLMIDLMTTNFILQMPHQIWPTLVTMNPEPTWITCLPQLNHCPSLCWLDSCPSGQVVTPSAPVQGVGPYLKPFLEHRPPSSITSNLVSALLNAVVQRQSRLQQRNEQMTENCGSMVVALLPTSLIDVIPLLSAPPESIQCQHNSLLTHGFHLPCSRSINTGMHSPHLLPLTRLVALKVLACILHYHIHQLSNICA